MYWLENDRKKIFIDVYNIKKKSLSYAIRKQARIRTNQDTQNILVMDLSVTKVVIEKSNEPLKVARFKFNNFKTFSIFKLGIY